MWTTPRRSISRFGWGSVCRLTGHGPFRGRQRGSARPLEDVYAVWVARWRTVCPPRVLLGLLLYGYATGVFSSHKIEHATYEAVPFRFIAGNLHPDHDMLTAFRRTFLLELKDLFVQILLLAKAGGCVEAGHDQPGRDQDPCGCLQAQRGQRHPAAGGGDPAAHRGRAALCAGRTKRAARGA
jgi:hypothetical protein